MTANARLMAQALRNRQAYERNSAQGASGALEYGAGMLAAVPGIGDALGFANDVNQMRQNPEQRTGMNMGLAALGLIPFVPPAVSYGLGRFAKARGVEIAPPPSGPAASQAGAIVYHGSPYKFDKFDASKIGTGEGAQAYGHGLYMAESKDLADVYRKKLTGVDGAPVAHPDHSLLVKIGQLQNQIQQLRQSDNPAAASMIRAYENRISELNNAGSLYSVDLPDPMIARMLDWDKPLSQQAPEVRNAVKPLLGGAFDVRGYGGGWGSLEPDPSAVRDVFTRSGHPLGSYSAQDAEALNFTGSAIVKALGDMDKQSAQTSQMLRQMGIPGIRYLDGGSRAAGEGTSNFVVFPGEEQALRILRRE